MRFRLPYSKQLRPAWLIRLGLFLYDHLTKRNLLEKSRYIRFGESSLLQPKFTQGFEYSDCWVDDARLVIANVIAAKELGAVVSNYSELIDAKRCGEYWQLQIRNNITQRIFSVQAKALVNAAGPWVQQILENRIHLPSPQQIRLVKGSHIIVKAKYLPPQAYILQNDDKRIVFAIPYLNQFLMIGTTDVDYQGSAREVSIEQAEISYLLNVYNIYFKHQLTEQAIVHSFSGVRPLYSDGNDSSPQNITRDYIIEVNDADHLPVISVFGGKLTTYRKLAEATVNKLYGYFPQMTQSWTASVPLPGGEGVNSIAEIEQPLREHFQLSAFTANRLATSYGCRVWEWLKDKQDMQNEFGCDLSKKEVNYLQATEFVTNAHDLLWRRTKLGLFLSEQQQKDLQEYIESIDINTL